MIGQRTRTTMVLGVVMFALVATGCGPEMKRLRDERDALFAQNNEAQNLIDDLRRANDALNMENQSLRDTNAGGVPERDNPFGDVPDVEVTQTANTIAVNVPGDTLFAPGKAELTNSSKSTLAQIASIIQSKYPGKRVRVEGYTDTDPIKKSGWKDNLELSLQRSAAVYRYLDDQGLSPELMYASGFGPQKPKGTKQASRRVEIVVLLSGE